MTGNEPTPEKRAEWAIRAQKKGGIVPDYFEVFPDRVKLVCGKCQHPYIRNLVPKVDEPTFACPKCTAKNWIPLIYK